VRRPSKTDETKKAPPERVEPVNYDLLERLRRRPHPLLDPVFSDGDDYYLGEVVEGVMHQSVAAHHLLDVAGVALLPHQDEKGATELDARLLRVLLAAMDLQARLGQLAAWHCREARPGGKVGLYCDECGNTWPCDTYKLATGTYEL
jgi:hypothetical protein